MPARHRAHLHHVKVHVGLEQPCGGVHGIYVEDQLPQPRLRQVQVGGDLLALAGQAGKRVVVGDREISRVSVRGRDSTAKAAPLLLSFGGVCYIMPEKPLVTRLEISRLRMVVEDGPGAPWCPAGACGFTVRG